MEVWAALSPLCCKAQDTKMSLSGQKWPVGCHSCEPEVTLTKCKLLRNICRGADQGGKGVSLLRVLSSESWRFIWVWVHLQLFWGWQCCVRAGGFSVFSSSTDNDCCSLSVSMSTELWFQWRERNEGNSGCTHSIFTLSSPCCSPVWEAHLSWLREDRRCLSLPCSCPQLLCSFETQLDAEQSPVLVPTAPSMDVPEPGSQFPSF